MKKTSIKSISCRIVVALIILSVLYLYLNFTHLGVPPEYGVWVSTEHNVTLDVEACEIELVYNGTLQRFNIYYHPEINFIVLELDHEGPVDVGRDVLFRGTVRRYFNVVHFRTDDGQINCWLKRSK